MGDNTVGLSKDPQYKQTVANTIRLLREIREYVEKDDKTGAFAKIDFAIEAFEGQEHI